VLDERVAGTLFSEVTAITETASGTFSAEIHPNWTIGGKPNGGYLLAVLGRAATTVGHHTHVLATSAHYLSAPQPGPVVIHTELLRGGRSASQVRATLVQGETSCVEALVTAGELDPDAQPYWSAGVPVRDFADFDKSVRVPAQTPVGIEVLIMDEVDLRLDPAVLNFAFGAPSGAGELRGWLALGGNEDFDPCSLLYAVDAFPPATFEIAPTGWVPTLELTAYVRALPAPGPLKVLQQARLIEGQKVDEACFVWDSRDRLVAQATQLAGIRLG